MAIGRRGIGFGAIASGCLERLPRAPANLAHLAYDDVPPAAGTDARTWRRCVGSWAAK